MLDQILSGCCVREGWEIGSQIFLSNFSSLFDTFFWQAVVFEGVAGGEMASHFFHWQGFLTYKSQKYFKGSPFLLNILIYFDKVK